MARLVRTASMDDIPAMQELISRSGLGLSVGFYTAEQAAAVTEEVFGVDSQLVADETFFVVEWDGAMAACGGWGKRSTPYGGDKSKQQADRLLDPATEAAKIRAFFVEPAMARRGLGSLLMQHCAAKAADAGFATLELVSTLPGVPLYERLGFVPGERFDLPLRGGTVPVPVIRMRRSSLVGEHRE